MLLLLFSQLALFSFKPFALLSTSLSLNFLVSGFFIRVKLSLQLLGDGVGFRASVWTLLALLGLDSVFRLSPWAYVFMKTAGACYLLYLAWSTWRNARQPVDYKARAAKHAFRDGILLNMTNPKSVLFAATVLIVIFPPDLPLYAKAFIMVNQFVVEFATYTLLAFVLSTKSVSEKYLAAKTWLDRFAAIVLGGLGLRLLLQK